MPPYFMPVKLQSRTSLLQRRHVDVICLANETLPQMIFETRELCFTPSVFLPIPDKGVVSMATPFGVINFAVALLC